MILFMVKADLVFLLINAVKSSNRKLFHKCNGEMANLLFAYDGQNYCRLVVIKDCIVKDGMLKDGMGKVCKEKSLRHREEIA